MWEARESSVSPNCRARRQVNSILQGLGSAFKMRPKLGKRRTGHGSSDIDSPPDISEKGQSKVCTE